MKPKLEYAAHGPFVVEAQTKLNALMPEAQPPLKLDGKYFDKSVARVKLFQKSRGLFPDGVVGTKTWAALDGSAAVGSSPPAAPQTTSQTPHTPQHLKGIKVYTGARMRCSFGTTQTSILVHSGNAATVGDCKSLLNIPPFGFCRAPQRAIPAMDQPMGVGADHYVGGFKDVSSSGGFKDVSSGGFKDTSVGASAPLTPACVPVIVAPWTPASKPGARDDMSAEIDKTSTCLCVWSGRIGFT